jgi:hypothetical protein
MKELIGGPGLATGSHAYHGSGMATNVAAQAPAAPGQTSTVHEGDGHDMNSGATDNALGRRLDEDNDDLESDPEHHDVAMPPPSSSVTNTSTGSKRKYSALDPSFGQGGFSRTAWHLQLHLQLHHHSRSHRHRRGVGRVELLH